MAKSYAFGATTTNNASATTPMFNIFCTLQSMPAIFEVNSGSHATADNAVSYALQRTTTRGTQAGSAPTVSCIESTPSTANSTVDQGWSGSAFPTVSAGSLLQWGQHQRGTYRWVAYDYTKMIAAQTSNGLALMCLNVTSAFAADFSVEFTE